MWGSKVWYTSVPLVYYSPLGELTMLRRLLSQLEGDTFLHTPPHSALRPSGLPPAQFLATPLLSLNYQSF